MNILTLPESFQIFFGPVNMTIITFGVFTFLINLICWYQSRKRFNAVKKGMEKASGEFTGTNGGDNLPMEATMHWATSGQYNEPIRKMVAGLKCLEDIHQKEIDSNNWENFLRNLYSSFVEILPLCGIFGTLFAIFHQTTLKGDMDISKIQANFGLAVTSTLIALSFTAVNIVIEGIYLHKIEYVDNCKSAFAAVKFLPQSTPQETNNR